MPSVGSWHYIQLLLTIKEILGYYKTYNPCTNISSTTNI
ncbi:hypothetical protein T190115A13A_80042 [Tenacibaculum sp. 190524A02b]|uniref:Uncharacterized protein n=1 Tax=Tenacibaculum vairaonense TaxID=3137860 RepID=A0ABM9PRN1_9FLAO